MNFKIINKVIALLSAIYFLTAGIGYNVASYCCENCQLNDFESPEMNDCHIPDEDNCCSRENTPITSGFNFPNIQTISHNSCDACELTRFVLDNYNVEEKQDLDFKEVFNPMNVLFLDISIVHSEINNSVSLSQRYVPCFSSSGREIITFKNVLLI